MLHLQFSSPLYLPPDLLIFTFANSLDSELITFANSLDSEFRPNEMLGSKLFYTDGIPERFYFYMFIYKKKLTDNNKK